MPTFEVPPLSNHIGRTYLQQLIEARNSGLQRLNVNLRPNDHTLARDLRATFHSEVVVPLLTPNADKSMHNTEHDPDYPGTSGYLIGIDSFLAMYQAFRNCEAVQICFGMDNTLSDGGQLQLVFRGYQNSGPDEAIFCTTHY